MEHFELQQMTVQDKENLVGNSIYESFDQIQEIGSGGSCIVYKARRRHNGASVIISEWLPRKYRNGSFFRCEDGGAFINGPKHEEEKKQFIKEYFLQHELHNTNHFTGSNNACLYSGGNTLYMVMSFDGQPLTKESLKNFIGNCAMHSRNYVKIILRVLKNYAEEIDVIHTCHEMLVMDIKPDNFIITKSGDQLLYRRMIDYGSFEKISGLTAAVEHRLSYTNDFVAPEVMLRKYNEIGTWSDVFSFGKTVCYFLTGKEDLDPYFFFQSKTADAFRKKMIENNNVFEVLQNQSDAFFLHFYHFLHYTLAMYIMSADPPEDEMLIRMNETEQRDNCRRVRSMKTVIRMLDILADDNLYPELEEPHIRVAIRRRLEPFKQNAYGIHTEAEKNQFLFSEKLLPVFFNDTAGQMTAEQLMQELMTKRGAFYIEGASGCGKSAFMKYTACRMADTDNTKVPLPLYIPAADLLLNKSGDPSERLYQLLTEQLFGQPDTEEAAAAHAEEIEKYLDGTNGRAPLLLMIDGVNETGCYPDAGKMIRTFQSLAGRKNVTVVFSGQDQSLEHPEFEGVRFSVRDCSEKVVSDYLNQLTQQKKLYWYPDQLEPAVVKRTIQSLRTPLLAHCFAARFCGIYPLDVSQLPANEAFLLEEYLTSYGTNCAKEKIQKIFSPEGITVVPYAAFLMEEVLGRVCLNMTVQSNKTVSEREILAVIDQSLGSENKNGQVVRHIGGKTISENDYAKMTAFRKNGHFSWLSQFFVSCADHTFEPVHETIGLYLAAKHLSLLIKRTQNRDIRTFPFCFWRPDLPDSLLKMTALLLSDDEMQIFCRQFKKLYGSKLKRFFKKQIESFRTLPHQTILPDNHRAVNFETAGHHMRRFIQVSEMPSRQKRKLKWGLPDNQTEHYLTKVFSAVSGGPLSTDEKEKLGSAAAEVCKDPQAVYLARLLWQEQKDLTFNNKISIFLAACRHIEKITAAFLEKRQLKKSEASNLLDILIGYRKVFPHQYTASQLIKKCADRLHENSAHSREKIVSAVTELSAFLEEMEVWKECPQLFYTFGALCVLKIIRQDCMYQRCSSLLDKPIDEELLHEVSRTACADWCFRHHDYYPEQHHAKLIHEKPQIYRRIIDENENPRLFQPQEIEKSSDSLLLVRQFCLTEYDIYHTGDHFTADTAQLYRLTQLYVMINYAVSDEKPGRMLSFGFSMDGVTPACRRKDIDVSCPDILAALMGLHIFACLGFRELMRFSGLYIRNSNYLNWRHMNPKMWIAVAFFVLILVVDLIINPTGYWLVLCAALLLFGILLLCMPLITLLIWIMEFIIYKIVNTLIP